MFIKLRLLIVGGFFLTTMASAQQPAKQTEIDTSFSDYDALFSELGALLDSLTSPGSFVLFDLSVGSSYFNYASKSSYLLEKSKRITYSPSLSYFSKSGFGFSSTAIIVHDGLHVNPYQLYVTASYDYLKSRKFISGLALTHFFTKDSLPFYTSPLKNEVYGYFTYKKFWLKPSVGISYGWGARSDYEEREEYINSLRMVLDGFTRVHTRESINDFNLVTSVRHDFYWFNVLGKSDYVRFSPQIVFSSGTQKFGFNQTSNTYAVLPRTGTNFLYNSDKVYLDDQLYFQPLALSAYLKAEYSKGRFFVQPQLVFDYYFPNAEKNFTTVFLMNAGVIF